MKNPETGEALVTFPTHFTFKITGENSADYENIILNLVQQVDPNISAADIKRLESRTGKYISLTVDVYVTEQAHIDQVYALLKEEPRVIWAL